MKHYCTHHIHPDVVSHNNGPGGLRHAKINEKSVAFLLRMALPRSCQRTSVRPGTGCRGTTCGCLEMCALSLAAFGRRDEPFDSCA